MRHAQQPSSDPARTIARQEGLHLVEALLIDDAKHRRHSRIELVLRDGVVDHVRYERVIKIVPPLRAA